MTNISYIWKKTRAEMTLEADKRGRPEIGGTDFVNEELDTKDGIIYKNCVEIIHIDI